MIKFLIKGVIRDRHKSLFPVIVVSLGVFMTVLAHCWVTGILGDMVDYNARFATGHVKIMSKAYADREDQVPNDLALTGVKKLISELKENYPDMKWVQRIRFGGLLDAPDEYGETKEQGPFIGMAINLLSEDSNEIDRMNIANSVVRGRLPQESGEILISDEFAGKLDVQPGDRVTVLSSTMYGSMAWQNYKISGTVRFGVNVMDRGSVIIDLNDAQMLLDMEDAAGEILGYFDPPVYNDQLAESLKNNFNARYKNPDDMFAPVMLKLKDQNDLGSMLEYVSSMIGVFTFVFILAMSIVLWNTGLIGGLRRYGEIGVRLAIGEHKSHVYRSMIIESVAIGIIGSIIGTAAGLSLSYFLQTHGIDFSEFFKGSSLMFPSTFRAMVTPPAYYIGFIPGLFSTVLGTALSGIGVYKRKTAQLFKELET